ncbi:MAG TPA: flagellar hook protein [Syntrophus sp. (in: bacteria)]|nr:flagellar hook protein [Syntrophus sp. (in: bacteria)]
MASSTSMVSGLSSGIDWQSMITQIIAVEHKSVDIVSNKKTAYTSKLTEWQSFNTKLLALKTAAGNLKDAEDFGVFRAVMSSDSSTVKAADLLAVTTSTTASVGSYTLKVNALAAAQKLSSSSFASTSSALGAGYVGDLLINGAIITIDSTDTLVSLKDRINSANSGSSPTGVTAGLISYGTGDNRLILTSDSTGATGISLKNGGGADILNKLGFADTSRTAKNHLAGGDRTDRFTSTTVSIQSLLGLTSAQTSGAGDIVINGQAVGAIDLSTDSLSSLQAKLTLAGLTATITTETEDNKTYYRLMVAGAANTYTDKNNILETLGTIKGGVSDVSGVSGDVANTAAGAVITADTLIKDIDGYTNWASDDYILLEGAKTSGGGAVSDNTFTLSDTKTVGELLTKIQSLFGNVTASITGDGKITVVDNTSGASTLSVKMGVKNSGGTTDDTLKFDANGDLGSAVSLRKRQIVAAADASVSVDGVTVTRSKNTIDDILTGVTIDLLKADAGTTITLNIGRDMDTLMDKINTFVTSYNNVSSYIRTQNTYDETKKKAGGILFADGTLSSVKSDLTSILSGNVWGVASDYSTLGLVGISVNREGKLSVDDSKLRGYLTTNFNDVQKLFTANAQVSTGSLAYLSHGINTKYGEYAVNITSAATKNTSAASDNTSLSGNETLTISAGTSTATISLTSSMTMTQIANSINSELATVYTQALTGAEELYSDSGHTSKINASTKWNSIYDSGGVSASLADNDVISFSGTARNGASISGSYTISQAATDSVQGLLSAVETAFGSQVTAAIDASGKIVITDKTPGSSSVALSFDYTQAHDLDFGTVLTTNPGGRKGRYAMSITASADTGNHLVMSHNNYGTGNSFTIHQQNNLLWTGGDQAVDNGVDVAGTINGESATGAGQVLTGDRKDANVDGLSVKYTGTTGGGFDAGTLKLTLGVAELYDRALFSITDSFEGYVTDKQKSLQNNIDRFQTQMDDMEARLNRKREQMISRFVKMELALQKIQSQSNWLAGQLNSADKAWRTT